jgi:ADP-heptose:LPS heptosyltransferase
LELMMAITAVSNMYIGIDTGPTHIASTLQIPMVAFYYASHPATQFAPKEKSNLLTLTASSDMSLKSIAIEPIIEFVRQFET